MPESLIAELDILYQDADLVAVNKPHGLLVHRSNLALDAKQFAVQILRSQLMGRHVYPCHRIDRKTGGVLLFALDPEMARAIQDEFMAGRMDKRYLALVRGWFPEEITVDYPITNHEGKTGDAVTVFRRLDKTEVPVPFGKHTTSRYSLIEARPLTGRTHQIRRHCDHIFHPIIGDRPHGCNKQNKLFLETWGMTTMLLHAHQLSFTHPRTKEAVLITAPLQSEFLRMLDVLGFGGEELRSGGVEELFRY
ncbi:MAG: pseudouridylate synthase [Lewinellaceae bacterium]|nr:tRNA pseudouridine(65) synthase TruC [Saprospiraceae bacterium]MCB9314415.1 pseudouridylate synthase [Lewinellaceae bacterium]